MWAGKIQRENSITINRSITAIGNYVRAKNEGEKKKGGVVQKCTSPTVLRLEEGRCLVLSLKRTNRYWKTNSLACGFCRLMILPSKIHDNGAKFHVWATRAFILKFLMDCLFFWVESIYQEKFFIHVKVAGWSNGIGWYLSTFGRASEVR